MPAALTAADAALPTPAGEELFGHPKGLYVCFFTELWERFSFYGMKALLLLYLVKHHLFSDSEGYATLGAYGGLVYATPLLGGLLADRYLGMRKSVVLGGVLLCLGHLGMSVEGHAATVVNGVVQRDHAALSVLYLSLALIISGVGFLKPNISTMVGKLYAEGDPRRDSGFTVFYAGINTGALLSSLICGYVGETYGWGYGFGAAAVGMLAGLVVFLTGQKYLLGYAEPPDPALLRKRVLGPLSLEWAIYLGTAAALPAIWLLMQIGEAVLTLQLLLMAAWLAWLAWYVTARCDARQRGHMLACAYFIATSLLFFALYEQTYGSWVLFTDRMLTKDLFPSIVIHDSLPATPLWPLAFAFHHAATNDSLLAWTLYVSGRPMPWSVLPLVASPFSIAAALRARSAKGAKVLVGSLIVLGLAFVVRDCLVLPQTAGSLTYLGSLFIVLLAPLFAWLWPWLERRRLNPTKSLKNVVGLALSGVGFIPLASGNAHASASHLGSVWWLVLAYAVIEVGEIILSPIGLSAITELSVPAVVGLTMGAYWLGSSFSEQLMAIFSSLAALDTGPGAQVDFAQAAARYGGLFNKMIVLGLGAGVVALLMEPVVRRWMGFKAGRG